METSVSEMFVQVYTASQPRRTTWSSSPLWEPQTSQAKAVGDHVARTSGAGRNLNDNVIRERDFDQTWRPNRKKGGGESCYTHVVRAELLKGFRSTELAYTIT
jgi:hypothetical protein